MEDRTFEWWFYKVPQTYGDDDDLRVHLGIPRTGSSSIRWMIRKYCQVFGEGYMEYGDGNRLIDHRHRYVVSETPYPVHRETSRTCRYFTTLREPVEALLSLYYWRHYQGSPQSLSDFVEGLPERHNYISRWLAHLEHEPFENNILLGMEQILDPESDFNRFDPVDLFERASAVLETRFALVGLIEKIEETLFMMAEALGWITLPWLQRVNFSLRTDDPKLRDLAPPLRDKLLACTEVDRALYERIRAEFLAREEDIVPRHGPHISAYRKVNHGLQTHILSQKGLVLRGGRVGSPDAAGDVGDPGPEIDAVSDPRDYVLRIRNY